MVGNGGLVLLFCMDGLGVERLEKVKEVRSGMMVSDVLSTNDLNCSRLVFVCGPAAAVERAEESVHLGFE